MAAEERVLTKSDLKGSGLRRRSASSFALTEDRLGRLCQSVRAANTLARSAEFVGVNITTLAAWRRRGEEAREALDAAGFSIERERVGDTVVHFIVGEGEAPWISHEDLMCMRLVIEMAHNDAEAEVRLVTQWSLAAGNDWRANERLLSKRWPERWGDTVRTEITGAGGGPISIEPRPDLALAIAANPEARRAATALLAMVVPASVERMDFDLSDDVEEEADEDLPNQAMTEEPEETFDMGDGELDPVPDVVDVPDEDT